MTSRESHTGIIVRCNGTVALATFDTLDDLQEAVGGRIEPLHLGKTNPNPAYAEGIYAEPDLGQRVDIYINDEGRLNMLPLNLPLASVIGVLVHGDVVITGKVDSEGYNTDIPEEACSFPVFYREPHFSVTAWDGE